MKFDHMARKKTVNAGIFRFLYLASLVVFMVANPVWAAVEDGEAAGKIVDPMAAGNLIQLTLGLLAVLLVLGGLAWFMRRVVRIQGVAGGALRVVGGLSMGARERVVLVQVGPRQLLLGVAPGRIETLHVLEEPLAETRSEAGTDSFARSLRAALGKGT